MTEKIQRQKKEHIPEFSSVEEEAGFWDTHSLADYWDEFKPVEVHFAQNLSDGFTLRIDSETGKKIRSLARKKGIGATALINTWIKERLKEVRSSEFFMRDK
jgi:predicted HicB family RNase H-like nuclease